jgi:enediyne biosynthesis protein E4
LVDEVRSGSSYVSNNDMRVHFGLGAAIKVDSVEVRWPSGLTERFDNVAIDRINEVKEGSGVAVKNEPPKADAGKK